MADTNHNVNFTVTADTTQIQQSFSAAEGSASTFNITNQIQKSTKGLDGVIQTVAQTFKKFTKIFGTAAFIRKFGNVLDDAGIHVKKFTETLADTFVGSGKGYMVGTALGGKTGGKIGSVIGAFIGAAEASLKRFSEINGMLENWQNDLQKTRNYGELRDLKTGSKEQQKAIYDKAISQLNADTKEEKQLRAQKLKNEEAVKMFKDKYGNLTTAEKSQSAALGMSYQMQDWAVGGAELFGIDVQKKYATKKDMLDDFLAKKEAEAQPVAKKWNEVVKRIEHNEKIKAAYEQMQEKDKDDKQKTSSKNIDFGKIDNMTKIGMVMNGAGLQTISIAKENLRYQAVQANYLQQLVKNTKTSTASYK